MMSDRVSGSVSRLRLPFAIAAVALAVFATHIIWQREAARTAVAEGEAAFRRGDFLRSADHFQAALDIDPASPAVRGRLAAAYAGMSDASLAQASGVVLDAEARTGLLAASALRASAPNAEAGGRPIADERLRQSLADRWSATIADGIGTASRAVSIDRGHEGAMLTLAGWYQLAADLAASPDEYRRQVLAADEWRHKALDARRRNAERSAR